MEFWKKFKKVSTFLRRHVEQQCPNFGKENLLN